MILEIAQIDIKPGSESAFEAAVGEAAPLFLASKGCHGLELQRGIEHPSRYLLMVKWETVEDHMVTFRESAACARWRELAGPHFTGQADVRHVETVVAAG